MRGPDTDLDSVNFALTRALSRCSIDPDRIAIGGFSDGATYALSLGLSNGDLYRGVVALSPGGVAGGEPLGRPRIFVSHGASDEILPISRTSDLIVRALRAAGYAVTYRRFQGGHEVPEGRVEGGGAVGRRPVGHAPRQGLERALDRWFRRRGRDLPGAIHATRTRSSSAR